MKNPITWYNKIGFYDNPLSIKAAAFHNELFGYEKIIKEINPIIKEGDICFIEGDYGTGKSTILKKIRNMFKGEKKVIYYSLDQHEGTIDIDALLYNRYGFFGRLFKIKPKNIILLLDETARLNLKDINQLKEYFVDGYFKTIVLAGASIEHSEHAKEIKSLTGKNVFRLGEIGKENAVSLIRKRIGKLNVISDDIIEKIYSYNRNPRAFLKNTEDVMKYALDNNKISVEDEDIKEVLRKKSPAA